MRTLKTAVVTGATGFIGKALTKELLNMGFEVYGIGRSNNKFTDLISYAKFHKIVLDFEHYDDIYEILKDKKIDIFFHASYRGVNGAEKSDYTIQLQNLNAACITVLQAAKLQCKKYIYIGSVDEYEVAKLPDIEFSIPTHSRIYAAIKYSSEVIGKTLAYENHLEYSAALLVLTYGEGNATNILPNMMIKNSLLKQNINLITGNDYFDMIYINDAIRGIINVALHGKAYESYFIGHETLHTFREIVEKMSEILDSNIALNFGAYPDPSYTFDYCSVDRSKLFRDTGYKCEYNLEQAIVNTKRWLLENKLVK